MSKIVISGSLLAFWFFFFLCYCCYPLLTLYFPVRKVRRYQSGNHNPYIIHFFFVSGRQVIPLTYRGRYVTSYAN